jgi:cyclic peptide transporter
LVIVRGGEQSVTSFGYANLEAGLPVTADTRFEIGSCSKAFTALAMLHLERRGLLSLDDPAAKFLPGLAVKFQGTAPDISIRQLLHHTSGIPWRALALIPQSDRPDAFRQTTDALAGVSLNAPPGQQFEYSSANYALLGAIIEAVSKKPFEQYLQENIFAPLQLAHTMVGGQAPGAQKATGYKISFFKPRPYQAPPYRGNFSSGYVTTNATDMLRWLKLQLGLTASSYGDLLARSHRRDESVPPNLKNVSSYAMGWRVSLSGSGEVFHEGVNPNYTAYIAFDPRTHTGVAVLANSNSNYTFLVGDYVMKLLAGRPVPPDHALQDNRDRVFSVLTLLLGLYLVVVTVYIGIMAGGAFRGARRRWRVSRQAGKRLLTAFLLLFPFLVGIYLLPALLAGFTWHAVAVWAPASFTSFVSFAVASLLLSYLAYAFALVIPEANQYKRAIPLLVVLSIATGLANLMIIVLITSLASSEGDKGLVLYYFVLAFLVYILGRKIVQTKLARLTADAIHDVRLELIGKILSTTFEQFRKVDGGKVYNTLNGDTQTVSGAVHLLVGMVTNVITVAGAFLYLSTLSFGATLILLSFIVFIAVLYYRIHHKNSAYFEHVHRVTNLYLRQITGMLNGFKELSMHRNKRLAYRSDMGDTCKEFRAKSCQYQVNLINSFLVGESLLIVTIALVVFALPLAFAEVSHAAVVSFTIILLYLIGPTNRILQLIPEVIQLNLAWKRIKRFLREIPTGMHLDVSPRLPVPLPEVEHLEVENLTFAYKNGAEESGFSVGPVSFTLNRGEILFLTGGNGSGKTTMANLLTGLYQSDGGALKLNGQPISPWQLGEYFSVVFNAYHLFEKLYDVDTEEKAPEIAAYLALLGLSEKVRITNGRYSTTDLSEGQRRRLALLQCYLEDCPIFLFDELAAHQDVEYKKLFYNQLLPDMRSKGKIIIVITHDEPYYGVADKLIKMDAGMPRFIRYNAQKQSETAGV